MKKLIVLLALVLFAWGFVWVNNKWIQTTEYTVASEKMPEAFEGTKIVQISDLHNATFGKNQSSLIKKVEDAQPDAIFLTGDLIDSNRYDLQTSLTLVDALVEMSEVYFVIGNHEVAVNEVDKITEALETRGVTVLMNETAEWEKGGETIQIAGINDPLLNVEVKEEDYIQQAIEETELADAFTLMLSHRPEVFNVYVEEAIDVVFSGHAHGGQIRIPGIGGVLAPGQGWFPEMTTGVFRKEETQLVLSRGLGNSGFPLRVFNLPEIVVVTLEKE
ncbi:metallophosphoesterase [Planomicrobium sp. CPCC 101110]|uniref:metallophosphoesterase n=1 Tax=Planomicrobium sp. CPCC 101110 TaxID=2599619 RepID=UPI0011B70F0B|nr:metallophosphoesterase [Planomicrobium sp. CPCC 101110]TWT27426.1 metallophosphoesterase [Planomicrobium sp. CPCC 101110]